MRIPPRCNPFMHADESERWFYAEMRQQDKGKRRWRKQKKDSEDFEFPWFFIAVMSYYEYTERAELRREERQRRAKQLASHQRRQGQ